MRFRLWCKGLYHFPETPASNAARAIARGLPEPNPLMESHVARHRENRTLKQMRFRE